MSNQKCKIGRQWVVPLSGNKNKAEVEEAHQQFLKRRKASIIAQRHKIIANNGQPLVTN